MGGVVFVARILAGHVDAEGEVDVAALRDDRVLLDTALTTLAEVGPRTHPEAFPSRQHQLAYYLEVYATLVLGAIVERPDREGVPHLRADPFPFRRHHVDGRTLDLVGLRETIARTFRDPRVHVALACGGASCPAFRGFAPESVDADLDAAARAFVNDDRHVRVEEGVVWLSPIFRWYRRDFDSLGGAWAFVERYRVEPLPHDARIAWLGWDRTLNVRAE